MLDVRIVISFLPWALLSRNLLHYLPNCSKSELAPRIVPKENASKRMRSSAS